MPFMVATARPGKLHRAMPLPAAATCSKVRLAPSRCDGMNPFSALAIGFAWLGIVGISWLGWQLLGQNGRLLLRLEELEKRLDTLEFGEEDHPTGLAVGTEAPAFELPDLAGERRSLAEYRGQSVLLIFFNP